MTTISELVFLTVVKSHFLVSSFPEVQTVLMLFLTIPVTIASAERLFSKLRIIKSYLRSNMGKGKLHGLAVLSIEQSAASKLGIEKIIITLPRSNQSQTIGLLKYVMKNVKEFN